MKRTLSILLCLIICIAMFPGQAFAAGNLSAPGKLTAKVTADKNVTVSWSKVSSAKGYKVYRAASREGEDYRYTSYKCIKTVSSKNTVKYTDKTVKPGKKYFYKVKAYKVVNGKKKYSKYTKVKTAYVKPESWTAERLEKDIISYLTEKGYTVKVADLGAMYGEDWYGSHSATAFSKYSKDYSKVLKEVKKDVIEEVKDIKAYYETEDKHMESHTLIIGIDVKDSVNPYGISLNGADIYITDESDVEYNYLLSEEQIAQYRKEILKLINIERAKAGLSAVTLNNALSEMAQVKVKEFEELDYWDHISPVYGTTTEMAKRFGITDKGCYEILVRGAKESNAAMNAWMNSEPHRNVILNAGIWSKYPFSQIGIGVYATKQTGYMFWAVEFIQ